MTCYVMHDPGPAEMLARGLVLPGRMCEASFMTNTAAPNRDRRGRFQAQPLDIGFVNTRGQWWFDGSTGEAHCRRHCGNVAGRVRRTDRAAGWICSACVSVPCDDDELKATKKGSAECEACGFRLPMKKYPTTLVAGVGQVRDFRVCRVCRRNGCHADGDLGVDSSDPVALARAVATDWRPSRVRFRRVADSSASMREHVARLRGWAS